MELLMNKIKIGICGYGNLGRAVESEITKNNDTYIHLCFSFCFIMRRYALFLIDERRKRS